jgi:hypothetical protein
VIELVPTIPQEGTAMDEMTCDFCNKEKKRTRFCETCGVDYCDGCEMLHVCMHDELTDNEI